MKNKVKISMIIMFIMMMTSITVSAATFINSKEVIYDNSISGLKSTNVQSAVDELYSAATDYTSIDSRVTNLEQYSRDIYNIKGLEIAFLKVGRLVEVDIFGYFDEELPTANGYVTLLDLPDKYQSVSGFMYYTMFNSSLYGVVNINGGKLSYGYTRKTTTDEPINYPKGNGSFIHFTYMSGY